MDASLTRDVGTKVNSSKSSVDVNNFSMFFVVDYVTNPAMFTDEDKEKYSPHITDVKQLDKLTSGTIFGIKVDPTTLKAASVEVVVIFPFSSHISYPVKPGEFIWAIKDNNGNPRWISRVAIESEYECVNLSTHERKSNKETSQKQSVFDKIETGVSSTKSNEDGFNFPAFSLNFSEDKTPLIIFEEAKAAKEFLGEIVPRFNTKSCDYSVQGSNNTLMLCTTDRDNNLLEKVGTIELVAGRGQTALTSPATIVKNKRLFNEIDKTPGVELNENEGELDYINDSSRIFISMNSDVDSKFTITTNSIDPVAMPQISSGVAPCIVTKSTNQRIIARSSGDIKIIHESGSSIIFDSDGNIQINCGKDKVIRMGSGADTPPSLEPFVRGDTLASVLENLANLIKDTIVITPVGPAPMNGSITATGPIPTAIEAWITSLETFKSTVIKAE